MSKAKKGTKMRVIRRMLIRKKGCTASEVRKAVGWPSVSIPQRARQLGLKLRSERRYWST
jgi:hypothetical protein